MKKNIKERILENLKLKKIDILDLIVLIFLSWAIFKIVTFVFLGATFSWLLVMEKYPNLRDPIVIIFQNLIYYFVVIIIGIVYYLIKTLIKNFKNKECQKKKNKK